MDDLILRKATILDMDDIIQLQLDVFEGEQKIPAQMIPISEDKSPQWWCALLGTSIVGAVASWKVSDQVHWGRFATKQNYRGLHIGTKLARFSLEDLFSQGMDEIFIDARDATVKIICGMGGIIIGNPTKFYDGTVTPVILSKKDYCNNEPC
jgi:predicted GNAT family N-acyltransferase